MVVTVEQDVAGVLGLAHHHFCGEVFWTLLLTWRYPLSIQIKSAETTAVVAHDDPVWVQHWNNLEYKIIAQVFGSIVVRHQILQSPVHHKASI